MESRGEENEKTRGDLRGKKRADCSEPEQGQSSCGSLGLRQAELCPAWEPNHTSTHRTQRGKTEREQRWV